MDGRRTSPPPSWAPKKEYDDAKRKYYGVDLPLNDYPFVSASLCIRIRVKWITGWITTFQPRDPLNENLHVVTLYGHVIQPHRWMRAPLYDDGPL